MSEETLFDRAGAERPRKRGGIFRRVILFVLVVAALVVGGWFGWRKWFLENPRYELKNLVIETGIAKDEEEIRAITALREGINLFSFSAAEVRAALLRSTLNVAEVTIRKQLPDTVFVKVTDRLPLAKLSSDHLAADKDGLVFTILPRDAVRYRSIPVIENGFKRLEYTPGTSLSPGPGTPETLDERVALTIRVLAVFTDRPDACFGVASAEVSGSTFLELRTRSGRLIRLPWEDLGEREAIETAYGLIAAVFTDRRNATSRRFTVIPSKGTVHVGK